MVHYVYVLQTDSWSQDPSDAELQKLRIFLLQYKYLHSDTKAKFPPEKTWNESKTS